MDAIRKLLRAIGTIFRIVGVLAVLIAMGLVGTVTIIGVKAIAFAVLAAFVGATVGYLIAFVIGALITGRRNR